jgi:hypothetical protein
MAVERVEPFSIVETTDNAESGRLISSAEIELATPGESPEPINFEDQATELVMVESVSAEEPDETRIADTEILAYFNNDIIAEKRELLLSELIDNSREPAKTKFEKINEDYRLSSSMIAAGILSELNDKRDDTGSLNEKIEFSVAGNDFNSIVSGASSNWGYLSMPPDSGNTHEFRRYLIELELIQTK